MAAAEQPRETRATEGVGRSSTYRPLLTRLSDEPAVHGPRADPSVCRLRLHAIVAIPRPADLDQHPQECALHHHRRLLHHLRVRQRRPRPFGGKHLRGSAQWRAQGFSQRRADPARDRAWHPRRRPGRAVERRADQLPRHPAFITTLGILYAGAVAGRLLRRRPADHRAARRLYGGGARDRAGLPILLLRRQPSLSSPTSCSRPRPSAATSGDRRQPRGGEQRRDRRAPYLDHRLRDERLRRLRRAAMSAAWLGSRASA